MLTGDNRGSVPLDEDGERLSNHAKQPSQNSAFSFAMNIPPALMELFNDKQRRALALIEIEAARSAAEVLHHAYERILRIAGSDSEF